jgi:fibronectin type 3 domain-containing protein
MGAIRHAALGLTLILVLFVGCSQDSSTAPAVDTVAPNPPIGIMAEREGGDLVMVSWDQNAEADLAGYRVYRSSGDTGFAPATSRVLACPWYYDHVVVMGQGVCFKVTAVDQTGNESAFSEAVAIYINNGWRGGATVPAEDHR